MFFSRFCAVGIFFLQSFMFLRINFTVRGLCRSGKHFVVPLLYSLYLSYSCIDQGEPQPLSKRNTKFGVILGNGLGIFLNITIFQNFAQSWTCICLLVLSLCRSASMTAYLRLRSIELFPDSCVIPSIVRKTCLRVFHIYIV